MIANAMKIIANEVNKYVMRKLDPDRDPTSAKWIAIGNVTKVQDNDASGSRPDAVLAPGIMTLVNLEEERTVKSPNNFVRINDRVEYRNPKILLNLYCLFSVNHPLYDTALEYLSLIVQFFQYKSVIDHKNTPPDNGLTLDAKTDRLIVDMVSMNAEQVNHLWATLGGKYLPSVLYKVRMIEIEDDTAIAQVGTVTKMAANSNTAN